MESSHELNTRQSVYEYTPPNYFSKLVVLAGVLVTWLGVLVAWLKFSY